MQKQWMIYGANGYTGQLIAKEAKRRGLSPILAGRGNAVVELGASLGLPTRLFALTDTAACAKQLEGVTAVLHCAGPFSATSRPLLDACIAAKTNYFDITGEIDVFEQVHARDAEIKRAGITAIPGIGFDVVPTDCVAAMLKRKLPDATRLCLAYKGDGGPSAGTAKSSIEGLRKGGRVRRNGKIIEVPLAQKSLEVTYKDRPVFSVCIPWGDVSTAYYSTGIPNIEVYMAAPRSLPRTAKVLGWLTQVGPLESILKALAAKTVQGPSPKLLTSGRSWIWGEVENAAGTRALMRIEAPNGYTLTVDASLTAVLKSLQEPLKPGALTPSLAFGADFVLGLKDVKQL
ncbi:MAG: saccharopine dehydrogenase NADP-binding domain-containing protein [Deltaproteobacteria bacterium]|nr:saccharopine dehydrogenase NADP-binding domain-containing protein [Deltaproteobacteria bacterium]